MSVQDDLSAIFDRIANGKETEGYLQALRELFGDYNCLDAVQLGKYKVNIGQGQDIHVGDRTYVTWNEEAIQALIEVVQKQHPKPIGIPANLPYSGVVEFVSRDEAMSQLHPMLQQSHRVTVSAIAGMGGTGVAICAEISANVPGGDLLALFKRCGCRNSDCAVWAITPQAQST
jgi:hypothetical protein